MERKLLPLLYSATLGLSALLLFWVQPLLAKQLLPTLGGSPAVWNTSLLFFQTLLLAGYAYVLLSTRLFKLQAQIFIHLALLALAVIFLPPTLADAKPADFGANPAPWLLRTLLATVGLPFFVLSASAPLLQRWFAQTTDTRAADPYFLYAASNAGSLFALLLFPLVLEPTLGALQQSALWSGGYALLVLMLAVCGWAAWRCKTTRAEERVRQFEPNIELSANRLSLKTRLLWLALAFVPSSLVLGVTTYVTTDIAAVPLLWTLPLAIYLLTFVLAFARRQFVSLPMLGRIAAGAAVLVTLVLLSGATEPVWFLVVVHLAFFFFAALALHTRLAALRPPASRLAEYYLWLSLGGALGGGFNAIIAPLIFKTPLEYPLAIILACLLLPLKRHGRAAESDDTMSRGRLWRDVAWGASLGALAATLALAVMQIELGTLERIAIALGIPLFALNHFFTTNPLRFAAGLAGIMLASSLLTLDAGERLHAERNFYGTLRVTRDHKTNTHKLYHGSTLHGRQFTDAKRRCEPLSYYHRDGPLGSVFKAVDSQAHANARIAVVGLGTGAASAYARPNQSWTFYEINPAVIRLARDERFFTYLQSCAAAPVAIVLGDARLRLREATNKSFELIVLDAFSSDAIPVHLLTREALALYLDKLAPDGVLAMHVSNRSLNLHRVVSRLAANAQLQAFNFDDTHEDPASGHAPSQWIVLAPGTTNLDLLRADRRWRPLVADSRAPLWSDDYSSVTSIFKLW